MRTGQVTSLTFMVSTPHVKLFHTPFSSAKKYIAIPHPKGGFYLFFCEKIGGGILIRETVDSGIDDAISTVVGVVLLLGLLVGVTAFINVYYIPSWVKDDEASHNRQVFADFSSIPGAINDLVLANDTGVTRSQRIKLGSGSIPFISRGSSWGTLGVSPEGSFTVSADVLVKNITAKTINRDLGCGSVNITNVSCVSEFYIDIAKIQGTSEDFPATFQYITINFACQSGKTRILIRPDENHPGEDKSSLQLSTWMRKSDDEYTIIDRTYINRSVSALTTINHRIDLLSPCYGFNKVLNDATTPYNLTITNSTGIDGGHIYCNITYYEYNRTIEHHSQVSNGILTYESKNRHFIDQRFIYQNGAVFLCQTPNASMRIGSNIMICDADNFTSVVMPLLSIATTEHGTPGIGGSGVEELQMRLDRTGVVLFADGANTDDVTITIDPPEGASDFKKNYLDSWVSHFTELTRGTSITMTPAPVYLSDYTGINITLNGSIHLTIQDATIQGRIATISS